ncbi:TonB-dependent hemoglobin/transferrin/lactoferrin family receptor [Shewanella sp. JM162201]|uniref:TonB-dependent hemoglobin/transferrin/lactoferrin family receptor n=2 Tax=Shewanella jiangmenensis TaxID=2837387 RepID=A0ABS5V1Q0_9GAMM|nr:TonB-dependent hemoglobin/transferrin/lactoferrin family receptor [Shewanella jiangmenensis]
MAADTAYGNTTGSSTSETSQAGSIQAGSSKAQSSEAIAELPLHVVTATRTEAAVEDTGRSIAVVDTEKLAELQSASVAQTLAGEANIEISNGPRASSQGVAIRGLSGSRVLQTIDGARQNVSAGHRGSFFIDPELLSSVEVVRGAASSLWGSAAIGGVVAMNTRSVEELLDEGDNFGAYLKQGFETNGDAMRSSGGVYGRGGSLDWLLSGSYRDSDDIDIGGGEALAHSASRSDNALARLGWALSDGQRLELSARSSDISELVPSNPAVAQSRSVPLVRRSTEDSNLNLKYRLAPEQRDWLDLTAQLYQNQSRYQEHRVSRNQFDDTDYDTLGLSVVNKSDFGQSPIGALTLLLGADGYRDRIQTVRDANGQPGQRPDNIDGETQVFGVFSSASLSFAENWVAEAGVRYDSYDNESNNLDRSASDNALSPSFGLIWQAEPWLTLSGRYDEAFRAPSVEEMYSSGSHYCIPPIPGFLPRGLCNQFQVNENLRPEQAKNKELKADLQFSNLAGDDELLLSASVFRNDIDDFIVQRVTDPLMGIPGLEQYTRWDNVTAARLTGFELEGSYRYGATLFGFSYGETRGKDKLDGSYIEGMPANKLKLDLSRAIMDGDMKLGSRYLYVAIQDEVPAGHSVGSYDDYGLWDLYLSWQPQAGTLSGTRVDFAIENVGDEQYRRAWQTLYEPGRNFKLSLGYRF